MKVLELIPSTAKKRCTKQNMEREEGKEEEEVDKIEREEERKKRRKKRSRIFPHTPIVFHESSPVFMKKVRAG